MLKLYMVTALYNYEDPDGSDTFENFVIAGNEIEARRIVEEEVWTLSGMAVKSVEEVNMDLPQLLCFVDTDDM